MSKQNLHCCYTNKCEGKYYKGWSLNCHLCEKKIMVECLRTKDESRTKEILHMFGLMNKTTTVDGRIKWEIKADVDDNTFNHMFNIGSVFGITCETCKYKFKELQKLTDQMQPLLANQRKEIEKLTIETVNLKAELEKITCEQNNESKVSETSLKEISEKIINSIREKLNNNTLNASLPATSADLLPDENGCFSIFVTKSDKNMTADKVIELIVESTHLDKNVFKVQLLSKMNRHRKYNSFKIITFTRDIYDKIMDEENWPTEFSVRPFTKPIKRKPKNHQQNKMSNTRKVRFNDNEAGKNQSRRYNNNNKYNNNVSQSNQHQQRNGNRNHRSFGKPAQNVNRRHNNNRYYGRNSQQKYQNLPQFGYSQHNFEHASKPNYHIPFWYHPPYFYPPAHPHGPQYTSPQQQTYTQQPPQMYHQTNLQYQQ